MVTALLSVLTGLSSIFGIFYIKDIHKHKDELNTMGAGKISLTAFVTSFFDVLGIGNYSTTTSLFKIGNMVEDRLIPGTLNVGYTLGVVVEAFLFISAVEVEPLTLISMLLAASIGSFLGASIISKLPERKVKLGMGMALLTVAGIMLAGKFNLMPTGGDAIGLSGIKLLIGIVGNFILGGLMTIGIGLYAPCMALIYSLGMSPRVAFPIMMGSSAFLMPTAGIKFVKEGAYDRKASVLLSIVGTLGVLIAYYFVNSLDIEKLTWVVIFVVLYTGIKMLRELYKNKENIVEENINLSTKKNSF